MTTNSTTPAWEQDESLRHLRNRIEAQPRSLRAVSFDCFDTLVLRLCAEPSELFVEVGRQLAAQDLLAVPLTPSEFRAARMAADERARDAATQKGKSSEITLSQIYHELRRVVRDVSKARDLEFQIERDFCFLNPATAALARDLVQAGISVAIISDTYFTRAQIEILLRDGGLDPALFSTILVSCEQGSAKWNGHLYHDLIRHFGIHPSELLHLGDNPHADIQAAAQFGIETVHYYKSNSHLDAVFNGERSLLRSQIPPAGSLNALRVMVARRADSPKDPFRDGALVFGPILSRYADWCVQRFQEAGVRTVLALMREGDLLGVLVEQAAQRAGVSLNIQPCFVSRMATARAAMSEVTPSKAAELLEGSAYLTPQAVFDILGVGEEASKCLDAEARAKPLATAQSVAGLIHLLFKLPRMRDLIEARRVTCHALAFEYLSQLVNDDKVVGVLDLGWSGSIQRNITRILRNGGRDIHSVGCYLACTRRAGRLVLDGDLAHGYLDSDWAGVTILPEVAINAPIGSTDGYARNSDGIVVPVLGPYDITPEERHTKSRLRDGILAFQQDWLDLRAAKSKAALSDAMLNDIDRQASATLARLLDYPTKPEAERLGVLRHDENYFGSNLSAPLCDDETPRKLRREGIQGLFQASRCYWPQGIVARTHPRLVSALRARWSDPIALGRLGAWHGIALQDGGITDEELSSLGTLLHGLAIDQVIFTGPLAPVVEEVFTVLWQSRSRSKTPIQDRPRLICTQSLDPARLHPDLTAQCASVPGKLTEIDTFRNLRRLIAPKANVALVLTTDLAADEASALLNALAPFLGPQGTVLAACGRFDRHSVADDATLAPTINAWQSTLGQELGYGLWTPPAAGRHHAFNWIVFRRSPEAGVWNRQWTLTVSDLALATQTQPDPLLVGV
ncbi:MAG: HAD hydrolase-like protein [Verrucomicrobiales bacterium]|nr:HAD hydrolase-like protein [Verrucomicrobiales bacterium]